MSEYSDCEIDLLMRQSIMRMQTLAPLSQREMTQTYDEYRRREIVRSFPPIQHERPMTHAPGNVCGACGEPLDNHNWVKRGVPVCRVSA